MNRKNLIGLSIVILMVTSGPLYLPLVLASTQETINETLQTEPKLEPPPNQEIIYNYTYVDPDTNPQIEDQSNQESTYIKYHDRKPIKKPSVSLKPSIVSGESPLYVSFKTETKDTV